MFAYILKRIVDIMIWVFSTLLTLRFFLRLFGANTANDFVTWIYNASEEILSPFRGIFPAPNFDGAVVEFSTIFAFIVYGLIAMLAYYLIDLFSVAASQARTKNDR